MKKLFMLLTAVVALELQVMPARAIFIPLDILIATNGQILVGDKLFYNFKLSHITIVGPPGGVDPGLNLIPPDGPGQIVIQDFTNVIGEHGLRLFGPFQANTSSTTPLAELRFFLEYDVSVTDPRFLIHDVRHAFSFSSAGSGSIELFTQAGLAPDLNAETIHSFRDSGIGMVNEEHPFFNNVSSQHMLHVIDFRAEATTTGGVTVPSQITTSSIDLTFSQTPIPEPSTWLLLGTGIAGFALWRRHQEI